MTRGGVRGGGSRERLRDARRKRRRREALIAAGATVLVGLVVSVGALAAGGAIRFGPSAAPTGSPAATGVATTALPAPSFTETPEVTTTEQPPASETPDSAPAPAESSAPPAPPAFDRAAQSIDDPTSPWVVVDKLRPLRDGAAYVPPDLVELRGDIPNPNGHVLRADAAAALAEMVDAAKAEIGVQLVAQSGYRSYDSQVSAYSYYVNQLGTAGADLTSARPGYSEHQTGMAMDILDTVSGCSTDGRCFADTTAGQWLAANSWRFGWLLRYPDGATPITGYEFEPWHYRWVGVPLATEMHNTGIGTLEEFFGLPPAPTY